MKIKCSKVNLLNSLNIVSKAVSTKTTLPILECILIDVYADSIKLTANDLEIGIETILDGEVIEMGRIAIEAKLFNDIVRKLPNSEIFIETTPDYNTIIRCEKSKFVIPSKSGEDFTELPQIEKEKSIELSQFSLKEIIRQTIFSISDNENNKLMTGELFEVKDGVLQVVSLDGHRISIRKIELSNSYEPVKVVVPGKNPFTGTKTSLVAGTYRSSFTNTVAIVILANDPDVCADVIDGLANGTYVVVLENKYKGLQKEGNPGDAAFQVYGYYQGLTATAIDNDKYSEDTEGGWAVTLEEQKTPKSALFLFKTSYEATKTAVNTLTAEPAA